MTLPPSPRIDCRRRRLTLSLEPPEKMRCAAGYELHLRRRLATVPGVTDCIQLDEEGAPDVELRFEGSRPLRIECKNVLRQQAADGTIRLDFQRTRASKRDPCSRYYGPREFDVVAACLHAVTEHWQYRYTLPARLDHHPRCAGKLASNVRLDQRWEAS